MHDMKDSKLAQKPVFTPYMWCLSFWVNIPKQLYTTHGGVYPEGSE